MFHQTAAILRRATREKGAPLNILCSPTHERFESVLTKTNHQFFGFRNHLTKDWNTNYAPVPENYHLLPPGELPTDVPIDLCLYQTLTHQAQLHTHFAQVLGVPVVRWEHTMPMPAWAPSIVESAKVWRAHRNIFISDFSREKWGFEGHDCAVVDHALDLDVFKPLPGIEKNGKILSVVNLWAQRDEPCGYSLWRRLTQDLPVRVVGDNPGLSVPAASVEELVREYNACTIYLNTTLASPIPMSLLEAMSTGAIVISTATAAIPEWIQSFRNGFCSNEPVAIRQVLKEVLEDPAAFAHWGINAAKTIKERCSVEKFVQNTNRVFEEALEIYR